MIEELKSFLSNIQNYKKLYKKKAKFTKNIKDTYKNNEPPMYKDITTGEISTHK